MDEYDLLGPCSRSNHDQDWVRKNDRWIKREAANRSQRPLHPGVDEGRSETILPTVKKDVNLQKYLALRTRHLNSEEARRFVELFYKCSRGLSPEEFREYKLLGG